MFTQNLYFNLASGTIGGGSWTPADLTGVYIWLDASEGITTSGGLVTSWVDQISSLNFTSNSPGQFTYISSDAQFNNKPTLYWDKSNSTPLCTLRNTNIVYGGEDLFYWGVYLIPTDNVNENMLFSIAGAGGIVYQTLFLVNSGQNQAEYLVLGDGPRNQSPDTTTRNVARLFIGRRKNSSPWTNTLWNNKTTPKSLDQGGTFTAATLTGTVGNEASGGGFQYNWDGKIAEVGWCRGSVSDSEVTELINYLVAKYNITLS